MTPATPFTGNQTRPNWDCAPRRIVLAIGNMHRPRLIGVPGENLPQVSHYLADPHDYFGRSVLIVGGKNSAVEAAIRLYRVGARVTMSYRGETFDPKRVKYWLRPELEWLISKGRITFLPPPRWRRSRKNVSAFVRQSRGRIASPLHVDDVLLLTGYVQDTVLFEQLGVELEGDERSPKHDSRTMQTNAAARTSQALRQADRNAAQLFIENTHVHVQRIVRDIAGVDVPWKVEGDYATLEEA